MNLYIYEKFILSIIKFFLLIFTLYIIYLKSNLSYIEIDNELPQYENNIDFSNFTTDIKAIVFYLPQFHVIKENDIWWGEGFTEWTNVKKCLPFYKGHHQPRIPGDKNNYLEYYDLSDVNVIKQQVSLAKSHGIFGFAIYYYWFSGKRLLEKPLDIFFDNKDIDFHFLLIWANENWTRKWNGRNEDVLIEQQYKDKDPENFIIDIKKYLLDSRYIKIKNKTVLGLYEPSNIPNLKDTIKIWREKSIEYGIGEIFILISINKNKTEDYEDLNIFDAAYDFPPRNSFINNRIKYKNTFIYNEIIYKNNIFNFTNISKFIFYRGSMLEWDNCPRVNECSIFDYYSPEQFYMNNKIIINWTKKYYNSENRFIFINAWNEWGEGSYLEPDEKYGYSSINSLSKALFNLPYINNYNTINLEKSPEIAVQAHIYYEEIIYDIINKTNNIPVKFNLFISTSSNIIKNNIENYVQINSNAFKIEIKLFPNKGRDILPLLLQMKNKIKKYKYICHIHTKKSFNIDFGDKWRNYLFDNLLGSKEIISEILTEFENNDNLGFIFPETYYESLIKFGKVILDSNLKYMNYILKRINYNFRISPNYYEYPVGNMFWGKILAVYQIFEINIEKKFPREKGQLDCTLMHAIERIWVFIVQLNGYYYRKIFKHL